jgi:hypothetical protein
MSWVASGLAVAGGVAGYLGGSKGKKAQSNPYGALNPEQIGVNKAVGTRLNSMISEGPQTYDGQLNADMSAQEAGYYNPTRAALMSGTVDTMLNEANDPVAFNNAFNKGMVDPSYQNFNQNTLPGITEGYGAFTTAAGNARAQALQTLGNNLTMQRYQGQQDAKSRALSALGQTSNIQNYMAAPRVFQQAGLDRKYQDYVQGNQQYSDNIGKALSFLGISTGTYTPAQKDTRWSGAISGAMSGLSMGLGLGGGGGGTAAAGNNGRTLGGGGYDSGNYMSGVNLNQYGMGQYGF